MLTDNRRWEIFFAAHGLTPLRITYDEIADDVLGLTSKIRKHCGVPQKKILPQIKLKKQANKLNDLVRSKIIASFTDERRA